MTKKYNRAEEVSKLQVLINETISAWDRVRSTLDIEDSDLYDICNDQDLQPLLYLEDLKPDMIDELCEEVDIQNKQTAEGKKNMQLLELKGKLKDSAYCCLQRNLDNNDTLEALQEDLTIDMAKLWAYYKKEEAKVEDKYKEKIYEETK